jgi:hypothetical protein
MIPQMVRKHTMYDYKQEQQLLIVLHYSFTSYKQNSV